mgnify:FL=1
MNRSLATWQKADPRATAFEQSPVATMHALADMKADLMMMAELLRKVAMPTPEEFTLTAEDLAVAVLDKIQPREWHEWEESK